MRRPGHHRLLELGEQQRAIFMTTILRLEMWRPQLTEVTIGLRLSSHPNKAKRFETDTVFSDNYGV